MTAPALLAELTSRGVRLRWLGGDRLRWEADSPEAMTPELLEALRAAKPEILSAVRPQTRTIACVGCGRFHFIEPTLCYWCRRDHYRQPEGEPCPDCGEACEECLGHESPEGDK